MQEPSPDRAGSVSEGYATAASIAEEVNHTVVAAFDAGNLEAVAQALHGKYPDKPIIIAADDDLAQQQKHGNNPGREKAQEAADLVQGRVVVPVFAPGEQAANPKRFTDFNDLANNSTLGKDGLRRQVMAEVSAALKVK